MEFFLTVFPFVYISKCKNNILFYNTISGESIVFKNNIAIVKLVNKLEQQEYACVVNENEIDKLNQVNFFKLLVEKNLGYYIDKQKIELLPVTTRCAEINKSDFTAQFRNHEYIMENLREITFHINNGMGNLINEANQLRTHKSHKQFLFPIYEPQTSELLLSKIKKVIGDMETNKLSINILGGNVFRYSQIESLINILNNTTYNIIYYFHYNDWIEDHSQQILSLINENDTKIILVDSPFDEIQFKLWEAVVEQKNVRIEFLVESEEQIEEVEIIINKFKLRNYVFRPYYNENNYDFFKENVFVSEEDILSVKESLFELITKKISSPAFFGKLTIDVHENVYSNINLPPAGNIDSLNLKHLIYDLITNEESIWLKSKLKAVPCNKCIYNLLCPPISNYELVLNCNNLCNIAT
ncbi:MAG: hypothetical protein FWF09_00660 [Bacteroidales bacterium]|nr:hypothetical protein [Bacteroidales bacterium]